MPVHAEMTCPKALFPFTLSNSLEKKGPCFSVIIIEKMFITLLSVTTCIPLPAVTANHRYPQLLLTNYNGFASTSSQPYEGVRRSEEMLCLLRPSPRSSSYLPRHGGSSCYVQSRPLHPPSTAKLVSFSTSEIGTRCSVSVSPVATVKANALQRPTYSAEEDEEDDDNGEDFQVLTAVRSNYNDIVIVETPKSRMLLLDSTRMVLTLFPPKNSLRFAG